MAWTEVPSKRYQSAAATIADMKSRAVLILVLLAARRSPRRSGLGGSGDGADPAALLSAIFRDHKTSLLLGAALAGLLAGSDLIRPRR